MGRAGFVLMEPSEVDEGEAGGVFKAVVVIGFDEAQAFVGDGFEEGGEFLNFGVEG